MPGIGQRASRGPTGRAEVLQHLMRHRVDRLLLVASPYDCFILEEDGQLSERMLEEFVELGLRHIPELEHVSSGAAALERLDKEPRFNLVIAAPQVGGMNAVELTRRMRELGMATPVVLLSFDGRELSNFAARNDLAEIDRAFLWQGDLRLLLAIVKYIEDKWNAPHDSGEAGVPLLLVVEDNVRYYSSFLPIIYSELMRQAERVLTEGANITERILRLRARPRVLLTSSFEEAWEQAVTYRDSLLAILSDIEFPMGGELRGDAGAVLARRARELEPDLPIVLQSSKPDNERVARELGAPFLLKDSATLLQDLRACMVEYFAFGDFVFRLPDSSEAARAASLKDLEEALHTVPEASIAYHAERNHFSKWLRARAAFTIAEKLRPRRISDYPSVEAVRQDLIQSIAEYRLETKAGIVADFDRRTFDGSPGFFRVGGGSLGGKARGLAFVRRLLTDRGLDRRFPGIRIQVPSSLVLGTDLFDQFLDENDLRSFAINCQDEAAVRARIMAASFPADTREDLRTFLDHVRYPLAIRSSSLLEDSQHQPFSGVYETYMLPNGHPDVEVRLDALIRAIQGVYASTFAEHAKRYLAATPYRLEEERMAVILQQIVGAQGSDRFYPDVSGVARSYNFYPTPPLRSEDGVVAVALGLGRTVVEGGDCLRFCPRYPRHLVQFSSVEDMLRGSQREFWALKLRCDHLGMDPDQEMRELKFDLGAAEADGALHLIASTYSRENGAVYDGLSRPGVRLITFAPMLKHEFFPLADVVRAILEVGAEGMAGPVEIEFAINLRVGLGEPKEFGFLQIRPLALFSTAQEIELEDVQEDQLVCRSSSVLGNGRLEHLYDIVVVDFDRFDRARSALVAREVGQFNAELAARGAPYILIGVGRWGSADPWLGIPVKWDQISGARVIVESGFKDLRVAPSQGSHFFQNVTAFQVGYFTVNPDDPGSFVDWRWLASQPAAAEGQFVRHVRVRQPICVIMDGRHRRGVIAKPLDGDGHRAGASPPLPVQ